MVCAEELGIAHSGTQLDEELPSGVGEGEKGRFVKSDQVESPR